MADELPDITLQPIGFVRNNVEQAPGPGYPWEDVVSEIVINNSLTDALDNLDEFSHIIVISWLHKSASRGTPPTRLHPRGNKALPLVGLFASRSPHRSNSLGKATVRLLQRQGNVLKVKGLDVINGTPVIDIKPYLPGYDSVDNAEVEVPEWTNRQ